MSLDEAGAAEINAHEPVEMTLLREMGWIFKKGDACKNIDGKEVRINYSKISERGTAVTVDGRVLKLGLDSGVDRELQHLFSKIDKAPKKTIPKNPEIVSPGPIKIEPPECVILREQGWKFKQGAFEKEIDGKSVLIIYSDIKKRGGACLVAGKPFMPEDFPIIAKELKQLFDAIDGGAEKANPAPIKTAQKPEPKQSGTILDYIKSFVNDDVLEIFGDSGTGKTKFAVEIAMQTIASGKTVYYLDTERNLSKGEVEKLKGCQYKYTPLISEISKLTRILPEVDLVIIDSIGFPILTAYARMNLKEKGDALLNMIAIFGDLKEWAYRNNSIAIVINQPESDFGKPAGHILRPFGDKSQFAAKEIWKTELKVRGSVTKSNIEAFRSRSVGHKTIIATMEVSDGGTQIKAATA